MLSFVGSSNSSGWPEYLCQEKMDRKLSFLTKTYDMVDDPATDTIISWATPGLSFIVWNLTELCRDVFPKYFDSNNLPSFLLFLVINEFNMKKLGQERWEFWKAGFIKGQRGLLRGMLIQRYTPNVPSSLELERREEFHAVEEGLKEVKEGIREVMVEIKEAKDLMSTTVHKFKKRRLDVHIHDLAPPTPKPAVQPQSLMSKLLQMFKKRRLDSSSS